MAGVAPEEGLLSKLQSLLNNKTFSDVEFLFDDEMQTKFYGHRLILALRSDYFASKFYENKKEVLRLEMPSSKKDVMYSLLSFLYTDKLNFKTEKVHDLLSLAEKYGVKELESRCFSYLLKESTTIDNIFAKYECALSKNAVSVLNVCRTFVCQNAEEILTFSSFKSASITVVEDIIVQENLSVSTELVVLIAVLNWGRARCVAKNIPVDDNSLKQCIYPLLKHIRFLTLTDIEFQNFLEEYNIFSGSESSRITKKILQPHLSAVIPDYISKIDYKRGASRVDGESKIKIPEEMFSDLVQFNQKKGAVSPVLNKSPNLLKQVSSTYSTPNQANPTNTLNQVNPTFDTSNQVISAHSSSGQANVTYDISNKVNPTNSTSNPISPTHSTLNQVNQTYSTSNQINLTYSTSNSTYPTSKVNPTFTTSNQFNSTFPTSKVNPTYTTSNQFNSTYPTLNQVNSTDATSKMDLAMNKSSQLNQSLFSVSTSHATKDRIDVSHFGPYDRLSSLSTDSVKEDKFASQLGSFDAINELGITSQALNYQKNDQNPMKNESLLSFSKSKDRFVRSQLGSHDAMNTLGISSQSLGSVPIRELRNKAMQCIKSLDEKKQYKKSVSLDVSMSSVLSNSKLDSVPRSEQASIKSRKKSSVESNNKTISYEIKKKQPLFEKQNSYGSNENFSSFPLYQHNSTKTYDLPLVECKQCLDSSFKKDVKCSLTFLMISGNLKLKGFELYITNSEEKETIDVDVESSGFTNSISEVYREKELKRNKLEIYFKEPLVLSENKKGKLEVSIDDLNCDRCRILQSEKIEINSGSSWICKLSLESNKRVNNKVLFLINRLFYSF